METGPDARILWEWGVVTVNLTLLTTWVLMTLLAAGSWLVTRGLTAGASPGRGQLLLELVVTEIREQIGEAAPGDPDDYLAFVGTIFLFCAGAALLAVVPGYVPPTASLSTASALAACVFVAVPAFGIARRGWREFLKDYVRPTPLMLPFHLIGELSRTLALAVRLFGNMMSGQLLVAIVLSVVPFLFPAVLQAFGLLIGIIQAYVFAVLALVYLVSAVRSHQAESPSEVQERTPDRVPGVPGEGGRGEPREGAPGGPREETETEPDNLRGGSS